MAPGFGHSVCTHTGWPMRKSLVRFSARQYNKAKVIDVRASYSSRQTSAFQVGKCLLPVERISSPTYRNRPKRKQVAVPLPKSGHPVTSGTNPPRCHAARCLIRVVPRATVIQRLPCFTYTRANQQSPVGDHSSVNANHPATLECCWPLQARCNAGHHRAGRGG